ncbi:hypothetical protein KC355_g52 [Hortaea werneckii]|nr:hypothetical protein KC355_g52 [Hortaea werneckii]
MTLVALFALVSVVLSAMQVMTAFDEIPPVVVTTLYRFSIATVVAVTGSCACLLVLYIGLYVWNWRLIWVRRGSRRRQEGSFPPATPTAHFSEEDEIRYGTVRFTQSFQDYASCAAAVRLLADTAGSFVLPIPLHTILATGARQGSDVSPGPFRSRFNQVLKTHHFSVPQYDRSGRTSNFSFITGTCWRLWRTSVGVFEDFVCLSYRADRRLKRRSDSAIWRKPPLMRVLRAIQAPKDLIYGLRKLCSTPLGYSVFLADNVYPSSLHPLHLAGRIRGKTTQDDVVSEAELQDFERVVIWGSNTRLNHSKCHLGVEYVVQLLRCVEPGQMTMGFKYVPLALMHSIAVTVVRFTRAPLVPSLLRFCLVLAKRLRGSVFRVSIASGAKGEGRNVLNPHNTASFRPSLDGMSSTCTRMQGDRPHASLSQVTNMCRFAGSSSHTGTGIRCPSLDRRMLQHFRMRDLRSTVTLSVYLRELGVYDNRQDASEQTECARHCLIIYGFVLVQLRNASANMPPKKTCCCAIASPARTLSVVRLSNTSVGVRPPVCGCVTKAGDPDAFLQSFEIVRATFISLRSASDIDIVEDSNVMDAPTLRQACRTCASCMFLGVVNGPDVNVGESLWRGGTTGNVKQAETGHIRSRSSPSGTGKLYKLQRRPADYRCTFINCEEALTGTESGRLPTVKDANPAVKRPCFVIALYAITRFPNRVGKMPGLRSKHSLHQQQKVNRRHRGLFHVPLSALKQRSISGRLRTARRRMQAEQNI